mgnify:CR=1 FL=1
MDGPPLTPRVPRATLEKLRSVVRDCLEKHLDDSAVFFADKLVSMSGDGDARDPDDLFLYCQALFAGKHHRRALTVMRGEGLVDGGDVPARDVPAVRKNAPRFRLLAARCLAATREWDECLAALGDGDEEAAAHEACGERHVGCRRERRCEIARDKDDLPPEEACLVEAGDDGVDTECKQQAER